MVEAKVRLAANSAIREPVEMRGNTRIEVYVALGCILDHKASSV